MNCLEFRRRVGAEPRCAQEDVELHARGCPACASFRREMLSLDTRIEAALKIPLAPGGDTRRPAKTRYLALAASILLAAILGSVLWLMLPRSSLASDVVDHLNHEPDSWAAAELLPAAHLAEVSQRAGVAIDPAIGPVTYAQTCWFRGQWVPHLVVRDAEGPVTVLVLSQERDVRRQRFSESGYHGVIVPARRGAIAVLARDDARVDALAQQAIRAVQ